MNEKAIAIVSGGLDSVTLAHLLAANDYQLHLLAFDYGQRHRVELAYAVKAAHRLGAEFSQLDMTQVGRLLGGSALTDAAIAVPEGHYADPTMKATVVANRNAIMLAVAWGVAVAEGATIVATGIHAGDHPIYPDCRPQFADAFERMAKLATEGHGHPELRLLAPFLHMTKAEIVAIGAARGVPFAETWSCYQGLAVHCGRCGTCVERREAFALAGVPDPTVYEEAP